MMSMKQEGKPVSFVEDCAVPLPHLADYTERLNAIFARHGTRGTMYAHASEGCLHVRPVLNLKLEKDVKAMRAIAEETFAMVREYKGSHSGEHGDGIVRSEFHETMFGPRIVADFREVKQRFDPDNVLNPGKIVDAPKMDDRSLFRYPPDYRVTELKTALDWSAYPGAGGGFQGAVEMCNNNGACRKLEGGVMCPSYRATRNEKDVTRGRANTLRLAISGQLGPDALSSDEMMDTMKLCVSCKACRHECPTGVDMAKMKIEVLAAREAKHGLSLRDRLVGFLPRYAPLFARLAPLANWRNNSPLLRTAARTRRRHQRATRPARMAARCVRARERGLRPRRRTRGRAVRRHLQPRLRARKPRRRAARAGRRRLSRPPSEARGPAARPLCCGRTFLSAGLVDHARAELDRLVSTYAPFAARGVPIVGLEPSCLLTLRDELLSLRSDETAKSISAQALLFEEFLVREAAAGRLQLTLGPDRGPGAGARPLPSEIVRRVQVGRAGASADSGTEGRNHRIELLRHGRRVRLRRRHLPDLDRDGRTFAAARRAARRCRSAGDRRRHVVPAPDQGWHEPCRPSRRPRAGDEPRQRALKALSLPHRKGNRSMAELTLDVARKILDAALAKAVEKKLKPLVITILDARGAVKVTAAQDGTSLMRGEIAHGKAYGALAMGMGSRALFQRAQEQAYFVSAVNTMAQGRLVPVPGGVLIQDGGDLLGAVGVSGDTSDNDEICAIAGIEAAGLKANPG